MNPEEGSNDDDHHEHRDVEVPPAYHVTAINQDDLELTCLRVKLQSAENKNVAMAMELKCAQLQVTASEQLNNKRQELINMLETKMKKMQEDKTRLLNMVEELLKEKAKYTARLNDAAITLENLTDKFVKSEKTKRDLQTQMNGLLQPDSFSQTPAAQRTASPQKKIASPSDDLQACPLQKKIASTTDDQQASSLQKKIASTSDDLQASSLQKNASTAAAQPVVSHEKIAVEPTVDNKDLSALDPANQKPTSTSAPQQASSSEKKIAVDLTAVPTTTSCEATSAAKAAADPCTAVPTTTASETTLAAKAAADPCTAGILPLTTDAGGAKEHLNTTGANAT